MNNIEQFLFKQVRKFCSEADDSMFPVELYKSYEEVINFILSEVERGVEKNLYCGTCGSPTEYCKRCNEGDKAIDYVDISTIINNLRVK